MSQPNSASEQPEATLADRRLLLLDDDAGILRTVAAMARRLGAEVRWCSTIAEFEEELESFDPDVVLVDLMMPHSDGIDVVSRVLPLSRAAIYVMSGADKRTFEAAREVLCASGIPVAGFLHKPFGTAELVEALGAAPRTGAQPSASFKKRGLRSLLSPDAFAQAVRDGRVEAHFQPILHARTLALKGFEALARMAGEPAAAFAPEYVDHLTQDSELAGILTEHIIDRSLAFISSCPHAADLSVSVNVFGTHAVAEGFRERLVRRCEHYGVAGHRLTLELSEATLFELNDEDLRKITQLRLAGFGLSIDDFGTGNSSLARLASLPFSELKIDRSFCLALRHSEAAEAVVEACLGLAMRLDMQVTAEGIEDRDTAALLAAMGCDALQGHYFGRAMRAGAAQRWIAAHRFRAAA